ncbi:MAG: hemin uptake protein HemP [Planctomycetaceae bacterium]
MNSDDPLDPQIYPPDGTRNPSRPLQKKGKQVIPQVPLIQSVDLMGDNKEVQIQHGSELYRLCLTKSGKLILHK